MQHLPASSERAVDCGGGVPAAGFKGSGDDATDSNSTTPHITDTRRAAAARDDHATCQSSNKPAASQHAQTMLQHHISGGKTIRRHVTRSLQHLDTLIRCPSCRSIAREPVRLPCCQIVLCARCLLETVRNYAHDALDVVACPARCGTPHSAGALLALPTDPLLHDVVEWAVVTRAGVLGTKSSAEGDDDDGNGDSEGEYIYVDDEERYDPYMARQVHPFLPSGAAEWNGELMDNRRASIVREDLRTASYDDPVPSAWSGHPCNDPWGLKRRAHRCSWNSRPQFPPPPHPRYYERDEWELLPPRNRHSYLFEPDGYCEQGGIWNSYSEEEEAYDCEEEEEEPLRMLSPSKLRLLRKRFAFAQQSYANRLTQRQKGRSAPQ